MILVDGGVDSVFLNCGEEDVADGLSIREGCDVGQHGVECGAIEELAVEDYGGDFCGVGDVVERVGVEQDEICEPGGFYSAEIGFVADEAGGTCGCGLQSLERCQAGLDEEPELRLEGGNGGAGGS